MVAEVPSVLWINTKRQISHIKVIKVLLCSTRRHILEVENEYC